MGTSFGSKLGTGMIMALLLASCLNKDGESTSERVVNQVTAIDTYLAGQQVTAVEDPSGIRMVISKLGKGFPAKIYSASSSNTIDVDYVGRLFPDGTQFDAGNTKGPLLGYIDGWKIAFTTLPEGSVARIYVPSDFGYGPSGSGSIPSNSILEFDVTFKKISRSSAQLQLLATDTVAIDNYLTTNEIMAEKDSTGFRYVVTKAGTGPFIGLYTPVSFHVAYKLLTDPSKVVAEFDQAPDGGLLNRPVDQTEDALKGALRKVRSGSDLTIYAPSLLAFDTRGAGTNQGQTIPPNANVIIEITDLKIVDQ